MISNSILNRKLLKEAVSNSIWKLKFLNYNVLADSLLEVSNIRPNKKVNSWQIRSKMIIEEIQKLDPDIINLQELDFDEKCIKEYLQDNGYSFQYKKRSGYKSDGLATFAKKSKFSILEEYQVEFNDLSGQTPFNKENVGLITVLDPIGLDNIILVIVNCHLLFNLKRGEIKLSQIYGLSEILRLSEEKYRNKKIVKFWSGDFNSLPCSKIYELMTKGSIELDNLNLKDASCQFKGKFNRKKLDIRRILENNYRAKKNSPLPKEDKNNAENQRILFNLSQNFTLNLESQKIAENGYHINIMRPGILSRHDNEEEKEGNDIKEKALRIVNSYNSAYSTFQKRNFKNLNEEMDQETLVYNMKCSFEPFYTSIKDDFIGTLDYILFCDSYLATTLLLDLNTSSSPVLFCKSLIWLKSRVLEFSRIPITPVTISVSTPNSTSVRRLFSFKNLTVSSFLN